MMHDTSQFKWESKTQTQSHFTVGKTLLFNVLIFLKRLRISSNSDTAQVVFCAVLLPPPFVLG